MSIKSPNLLPEQLLTEVDSILRDMPKISTFYEAVETEHYAWLGRASALVHRWDQAKGLVRFDGFARKMGSGKYSEVVQGVQGVLTMLHELRNDAILSSPRAQSTNISTGSVFDYFDEVRKAIELARSDVFFVDPYLDAEFISRFIPAIAQGVPVRLLAREKLPSLVPAASLFQQQHGTTISIRSALGFHDRYVFVDRTLCYQSGASFKDGAKKAPTTLTQIVDAFPAVLDTYEKLWSLGTTHL